MPRISQIAELQARKQALITESEVYREHLLAELDNLKTHADGLVRKVDRVRQIGPWFMFAAPLLLPVFRLLIGKRFKAPERPRAKATESKLGKLLWGLRLFSKYGPVLRSVVDRLRTRGNSHAKQHRWTHVG